MSEPTGDSIPTNENGAQIPEGFVSLMLAHPLGKVDAARVRARSVRDYKVNTPIVVPLDEGSRLIESAMIQVDPFDRTAVRKMLGLNDRDQPLTAEEKAALASAEAQSAPAAPDGSGALDAPKTGDQATETADADKAEGEKRAAAGKRSGSASS